MKELYTDILKSFCSSDNCNDWMRTPFIYKGKACATDAYFLATIDPDKVDAFQPFEIRENVLSNIRNQGLKISVSELKSVFDAAPKEDDYDEIDVKCEECDGDGEVEWEYGHHTKDDECPVCDGSGFSSRTKEIKNGKKVIKKYLLIEIGNSRFLAAKFFRLVETAEKLSEKWIELIYQGQANKGSLFKIGEFEILLMACINNSGRVLASYEKMI